MATRRKGNSNIMSNNSNTGEPNNNNITTTTGRYKTKEISPLEIANDDISSTNNNTTSQTIEEQYKSEREQTKLRHWKESEYAAGLVEPTWADEHFKNQQQGCCTCCCSESSSGGGMGQMFQEEIDPGCGCIFLSALVCSKLNAGRIGNMIILKERYVMVEVDEEEDEEEGGQEQIDGFVDEEALHQRNNKSNDDATTEKNKTTIKRLVRKREIQFMLGPFWPMLLFITYPLIFGVSALTLYTAIPGKPIYVQIGWAILTLLLIRALFNTGFRDPGILMRHKNPPPVKDDTDDENTTRRVGFRWGNENGPWRWSDPAQSYRPRNSMYCPDCKVIIEEFDHTCPWTGTAIGKKNMGSFQMFVGMVFLCLIMDIFLLTSGAL